MINLKVLVCGQQWVINHYLILSNIDTNSSFEVHIKSDAVKVGDAVIQFPALNTSNKYIWMTHIPL